MGRPIELRFSLRSTMFSSLEEVGGGLNKLFYVSYHFLHLIILHLWARKEVSVGKQLLRTSFL